MRRIHPRSHVPREPGGNWHHMIRLFPDPVVVASAGPLPSATLHETTVVQYESRTDEDRTGGHCCQQVMFLECFWEIDHYPSRRSSARATSKVWADAGADQGKTTLRFPNI